MIKHYSKNYNNDMLFCCEYNDVDDCNFSVKVKKMYSNIDSVISTDLICFFDIDPFSCLKDFIHANCMKLDDIVYALSSFEEMLNNTVQNKIIDKIKKYPQKYKEFPRECMLSVSKDIVNFILWLYGDRIIKVMKYEINIK